MARRRPPAPRPDRQDAPSDTVLECAPRIGQIERLPTLHALGRRHDLSRNLIRIWVEKAEAGSLDEDMASAELLSEYEARIAALERLVGRQALEIEFQKGAQKNAPSPRSGPTSVITGPAGSPSSGGVR